jgi:hypothetical protein
MSEIVQAMWTAICVFEILALVLRTPDLLRLGVIGRLAGLLALISLPPGPGLGLAVACTSVLGFAHPQLRRYPALAVQLLLLTPSAISVAAFWPLLLDADLITEGAHSADWFWATAPGVVVLCTAGARGAVSAPQLRVVLFWGAAAWMILTLWAIAGGSPWPWIVLAVPFAAAACLSCEHGVSSSHLRWIQGLGVAFVLPFAAMTAQAGPWTQGVGDSLMILRAATEASSPSEAPAMTMYQEVGLTPDDTFVTTAFQETAGQQARLGGSVALRHAVFRDDDWILSLEAGAGFEPITLLELNRDFEGHAQAEVKFLAGWGGTLQGAPVYAAAAFEVTVRPGDLPAGLTLSAQSGLELWPGLQANVNVAWEDLQDRHSRLFAQAGLVLSLDDTFALEMGVQSPDANAADPDLQAYAGVWVRF